MHTAGPKHHARRSPSLVHTLNPYLSVYHDASRLVRARVELAARSSAAARSGGRGAAAALGRIHEAPRVGRRRGNSGSLVGARRCRSLRAPGLAKLLVRRKSRRAGLWGSLGLALLRARAALLTSLHTPAFPVSPLPTTSNNNGAQPFYPQDAGRLVRLLPNSPS